MVIEDDDLRATIAAAVTEIERRDRLESKFIVIATGAFVIGVSVFAFNSLLKPAQPDLQTRIAILSSSLTGAAKAIEGIETEINQRQALVLQLQKEADTASKLKGLNKDQLDAVAQVLKGEIKREERQNFWGAQLLAFFYAGIGVALGELYHFVTRWRARRRRMWNTTAS